MKGNFIVVCAFIGIFLAGVVTGGGVAAQIFKRRFQRAQDEHREEQKQLLDSIASLRQQLRPARALPAPEQFSPQLMRRFSNQLDLTATQRQQINPAVNETSEDLRRVRRETAHSTELILEHLEDQIAAVLTPQQRNRFDEMIQHWRDAFQKYNFDQQRRQAQQRQREAAPAAPAAPAPAPVPAAP